MKGFFLALIFMFLSTAILWGQDITYDEEFQVNTLPLATNSAIASLSSDGFIICWEGTGQYVLGAGIVGDGIFAQRFDDCGQKIGDEFQVNTHESYHYNPAITSLQNGGFVICWKSNHIDSLGYDIYTQIYNEKYEKTGEEFRVNTFTDTTQSYPSIATLSNGGFIISWQSDEQDGDRTGIFAQQFQENGEKLNDEFQVNTYTNYYQSTPKIAALSEGGYVICWVSNGQDNSGSCIIAQLFDESGQKHGTEFLVNTHTLNHQSTPSIVASLNGGFIICWSSLEQDGSEFGIFAQRFDKNANKLDKEFQVNTFTSFSQVLPEITALPNGNFFICWMSDGQDGSSYGIFSQQFDGNGQKLGGEFQVNTNAELYQFNPKIASQNNGSFIICWASEQQNGSGYGIFAKCFLAKPLDQNLKDFELVIPKYDDFIDSIGVTFIWNQSSLVRKCKPWEITYDLYIDIDPDFKNPQMITEIIDTTYQIDSLGIGRTYFWKVLAKNIAGDSLWSSTANGFAISPNATSVEETETAVLPENIELYTNFPNPFNPETKIVFYLPGSATSRFVTIKIYDILGRVVRTLYAQTTTPGRYALTWDGRNELGQALPSGVYVYRLVAGETVLQKKMTLVR
ncbi:MAG: T9SS type A sorting domain-containing protein [Deferribacteres bacterium]|nr:T9SS type A sorting domain-containing protein [candidate division KSB1 bacterium]MCB9504496.1 T9SS type A sorting domain-containing protein [Deferribacteres bacterium]